MGITRPGNCIRGLASKKKPKVQSGILRLNVRINHDKIEKCIFDQDDDGLAIVLFESYEDCMVMKKPGEQHSTPIADVLHQETVH
jgi:hypothetical protein